MQITITANIPDEQANILAGLKGYSPTIPENIQQEDGTIVTNQKQNPQSASEYLGEVYRGIITADVSSTFISFERKTYDEQLAKRQQEIHEEALNSITPTIS